MNLHYSGRGAAARIARTVLVAAALMLGSGGTAIQQARAADSPCGAVSCCHEIDAYFQLKENEFSIGENPAYPFPSKIRCDSPYGALLAGFRFLEHLFETYPAETAELKQSLTALRDFSVFLADIKSWGTTDSVFTSIIFAGDLNSLKSNAAVAEIIVHELVHARWSVSHVRCISGELKGTFNCDDKLLDRFSADQPLSYTASYVILDLARRTLPKSEKREHAAIDRKMWELRQVINYLPDWLR